MRIVCLLRVGGTRHRKIPKRFHLSDEQLWRLKKADNPQTVLQEVAASLPIYRISQNGTIQYCQKCKCIKPYQCHHCPFCDRCILQLQFHNPLANKCIGFSNYKFFLLFLLYSALLYLMFTISAMDDFIKEGVHSQASDEPHIFYLFFLFTFDVCIIYFLVFLYHLYVISRNKTVIEHSHPDFLCSRNQSPDQSQIIVFHIGVKQSLQQVFGRNWLKAFLPIFTSEGDGTSPCPWKGSAWPVVTVLPSVSVERGLGFSVLSTPPQ